METVRVCIPGRSRLIIEPADLLWKDHRTYGSPGSSLFEKFVNLPDLQEILAYRRKAIEAGKSADINVLNKLYPGSGDEFKNKFVEAMSLFVDGCEMRSEFVGTATDELFRSMVLL